MTSCSTSLESRRSCDAAKSHSGRSWPEETNHESSSRSDAVAGGIRHRVMDGWSSQMLTAPPLNRGVRRHPRHGGSHAEEFLGRDRVSQTSKRLFPKICTLWGGPILFATILTHSGFAGAAEVKIFTSRAIATVLEKIGREFEQTNGHTLDVISGFSPVFVKRINAGEPFDVVVSPPSTIDALVKDGHVVADTRTNLVRSGFGVAVRAGAPKPDIGSVEAFKRALLNARIPLAISRRLGYRNWSIDSELPMRSERRPRYHPPMSLPSLWPRGKSNSASSSSRRS